MRKNNIKTLRSDTNSPNRYYISEEGREIATFFFDKLLGNGKADKVKVFKAILTTSESMKMEYIAVKIIYCNLTNGTDQEAKERQREQVERNDKIIRFYNSLAETENKRRLITPGEVFKLDHIDRTGNIIYYVFTLMPLCPTNDLFQILLKLLTTYGEASSEMEAFKSQSLQSEWFPMLLNILLWLHSKDRPHRDIKSENIAIATDGSWVKLLDLEYLVIPSSKDYCTPGSVPSSQYFLMKSNLWATKLDEHQRLMINIHGDLFALSMILCQIFYPSEFESSYQEDLEFLNLIISAHVNNHHCPSNLGELISQRHSERFSLIGLLIEDIDARTLQAQQNQEAPPTHGQLIITLLQMIMINEEILCHFVTNLASAAQSCTNQNEYIDFELQRMEYHPPELTEETKEEEEEVEEEEEEKTTTALLIQIRLFPRTENKNTPSPPRYTCLQLIRKQKRNQRADRRAARCLNQLEDTSIHGTLRT